MHFNMVDSVWLSWQVIPHLRFQALGEITRRRVVLSDNLEGPDDTTGLSFSIILFQAICLCSWMTGSSHINRESLHQLFSRLGRRLGMWIEQSPCLVSCSPWNNLESLLLFSRLGRRFGAWIRESLSCRISFHRQQDGCRCSSLRAVSVNNEARLGLLNLLLRGRTVWYLLERVLSCTIVASSCEILCSSSKFEKKEARDIF